VNTPTHTAQDLADRFGLQVHGDPSTVIHGVATLAHAGPGQLTFLANPRYRAQGGHRRAARR
jgi:UDP-3-O-[3-hydroxymyristoyl] glucosamine N-acyltransferase